jgi:hypothetical protein
MSTTPRIFIAASAAGLPIAEHLQRELEPRVICMQWRHGLLNLSTSVVEEFLDSTLKKLDLAVLVLSTGDLAERPAGDRKSLRDSVLFQIGLFVGALGCGRTLLVYDQGAPMELPARLPGVTAVRFAQRPGADLRAPLAPVCAHIKAALFSGGVPEPSPSRPALATPLPPALATPLPPALATPLPPALADASARTLQDRLRAPPVPTGASLRALTERSGRYEEPGEVSAPALPGHIPLEAELRFAEGIWQEEGLGSTACALIHDGQLQFIYSYVGDERFTGECYDWRLHDGALFGRFRRTDAPNAGYVYFRIESDDRLDGGWWYGRQVPPAALDKLPNIPGMHRQVWTRVHGRTSMPLWAQSHFRALRAGRMGRR